MNKKISIILMTIACCILSISCSKTSNGKNQKLTYTLLDMSSYETPMWIFDHSLIEKDKEYKYFVGEYDDADKNECEKGASLDAVENIVNEITQKVVKNNNLRKNKNNLEKIKNNIRIKINGIKSVTDYWERKKYKKKSSIITKKMYSCYKVVKIKKQSIEKLENTISSK